MSLTGVARSTINKVLAKGGFQLVRSSELHDWGDTRTFIPLEATIDAAKRAGLSVGDYIDTVMNNIPGATQRTIDEMVRLGVFATPPQTIVEIGPGSGRYLEKTIAVCRPKRYEVYETAGPWAKYVAETYDVVLQPTDGRSLKPTPDASADLVHAHKVFSSIPSLPTCVYFAEMTRITRPGGHVVFDLITESGLDIATFEKWIGLEIETGAYPAMFPRAVAINYFASRGFDLVGTAPVTIGPGTAELFVFRRR
jgi:SAM-dependent methyltransferase